MGGGLRKEGSELPFEFVGEVAGTSAVAEASDVESSTATRHLVRMKVVMRLVDERSGVEEMVLSRAEGRKK